MGHLNSLGDGDAPVPTSLANSPDYCAGGAPVEQGSDGTGEAPAWNQTDSCLPSGSRLRVLPNRKDCVASASAPDNVDEFATKPCVQAQPVAKPDQALPLSRHSLPLRPPNQPGKGLAASGTQATIQGSSASCTDLSQISSTSNGDVGIAVTTSPSCAPGSIGTATGKTPEPDHRPCMAGGSGGDSAAASILDNPSHPSVGTSRNVLHVTAAAAASVAAAGLAAYGGPAFISAVSFAMSAMLTLALDAIRQLLLRLVGAALFSLAVLTGVFGVAAAARFVVQLAVPPVAGRRLSKPREEASGGYRQQLARTHMHLPVLLPLPPVNQLPEGAEQHPLLTALEEPQLQHQEQVQQQQLGQEQQPLGEAVACAAATAIAAEAEKGRLTEQVPESPFTTVGVLPRRHAAGSNPLQTQMSPAGSVANLGGGGSGGPGSTGPAHTNAGCIRPSRRTAWSWGLQGWCGASRSRTPSLRSWVHSNPQGGCNVSGRASGASRGDAAKGTVELDRSSGTQPAPPAPPPAAESGASDAFEREPLAKSFSSISSAEECVSGEASTVSPLAAMGRVVQAACSLAGSASTSRTGPSSSWPSSVARLWQAVLPGLHLLRRPHRHSHLESSSAGGSLAVEAGGSSRDGSGGAAIGHPARRSPAARPAALSLAHGSAAAATHGLPSSAFQQYSHEAVRQDGSSNGVVQLARSASTLLSASCGGLLGWLLTPNRGSTTQLPTGAAGAGLNGNSSAGAGNSRGRWTPSNGSTLNSMVSGLLPRVTGDWGLPRSTSNSSLAALMEAAAAAGSSGGGAAGAAAAGASGAPAPAWDPLQTSSAHAFLLSSAEAAVRKPAFSDLPQNAGRVQVLSVDDEPVNQQVMRALLWAAEYEVLEARSGEDALQIVRKNEVLPDLVLLDVTLGGAVSGFEVCLEIRREYSPGELPVIMITCSSLEEDVIRGLAVGANDYLIKPLRNLELMARIKTQLALKRSIKVAAEARVNRSLLGSILPSNVIRQLKQGVTLIAQFHEEVTILFSDIRGFTNLATEWPTEQIILMLNNMFTVFDRLCDRMGVYKVETIGDAYMIVSGHDGVEDHAARMLRMATHMLAAVEDMRGFDGRELQIRVGIHTGPAHSGVVGLSRPRYCFFGDTVNTASRMESTGFPMAIQVSESTLHAVNVRPEWAAEFQFAPCGPRDIKGKGIMHTYLLRVGLYEKALAELAAALVSARASLVIGTARATVRSGADDAAAPSVAAMPPPTATTEEVPKDAVGDACDSTAAVETLEPELSGAAAAAAALTHEDGFPPASRKTAGGAAAAASGVAVAAQSAASQWRSHVGATISLAAADAACDLEDIKYASYRYHHQHMSAADVMSSGGINVLMDNGLAVLLPSHVMDLDSMETPASGAVRGAAGASIHSGAGGGGGGSPAAPSALNRAQQLSSGCIAMAYMPPPSSPPPRRLATATGYTSLGPLGTPATAASPANSARASLDLSGRGMPTAFFWGTGASGGVGRDTSGTVGSYSRTASGFSNAAAGGADAAASATTSDSRVAAGLRSKPASLLSASQSAIPASILAGSRTASTEASETQEEPSLQYAVNRSGGGGGQFAGDVGAPPKTVRLLSEPPALTPGAAAETLGGFGERAHVSRIEQLRRSGVRTSEELSAAAAAAAAGATSNGSADDDAAALAPTGSSSAAGRQSRPHFDFEAVLMTGAFSDDPRAAAAASRDEGALVASVAGWSLLVESLDPSTVANNSSNNNNNRPSRSSTNDAGYSLGSWFPGGDARPSTAKKLTAAAMAAAAAAAQPPPPQPLPPLLKSQASDGMGGVFDTSLDLEPTLAVAAEALAAAIDSALNSDAGDLIAECAAMAFGRSAAAGDGGVGRHDALARRIPSSAPVPTAAAAAAAPTASPGMVPPQYRPTELSPESAAAAAAAAAASGAVHDGRVRLAGSPSGLTSPSTTSRPCCTASNGGDAIAGAAGWPPARLSYERPSMAAPARGPCSGGRLIGADAEAEGAQERFLAAPGSAGAAGGPGNPWPSSSFTGAPGGGTDSLGTASGIHSPRQAGSKDLWGSSINYKRPATATGTLAIGTLATSNVTSNASARCLARGTAPPLAQGSSGTSAGNGAIASGGSSLSPATALAQRSGLYGSSSSSSCVRGAVGRQRSATAHGFAAVGSHGGRDPAYSENAPSAPVPSSGGVFRSQVSVTGRLRPGPHAAAGNGDELVCRALAGPTDLPRTDSATSSRGGNLLLRSRKSFNSIWQCGGGGTGGGATSYGNMQGQGGVLLASAGSMGGVSIISQGWSNLYDPLYPRPRLTDHYCASGDLEDFGSAGARTPGSLLSPSVGSGPPWDFSAQPSPNQLTPAHSANVAASAASAAAAAATAAAAGVPPKAAAGGGATVPLAAAVSRGGSSAAASVRPSPPNRSLGTDGGSGFDPMFGELSGVASVQDVAYGTPEMYGDAVEADPATMLPSQAQSTTPAAAAAAAAAAAPQPRATGAIAMKARPATDAVIASSSRIGNGGSSGGVGVGMPAGVNGWVVAAVDNLEPADAILMLDPTRSGYTRGAITVGEKQTPRAAAPLGRSCSLDVNHRGAMAPLTPVGSAGGAAGAVLASPGDSGYGSSHVGLYAATTQQQDGAASYGNPRLGGGGSAAAAAATAEAVRPTSSGGGSGQALALIDTPGGDDALLALLRARSNMGGDGAAAPAASAASSVSGMEGRSPGKGLLLAPPLSPTATPLLPYGARPTPYGGAGAAGAGGPFSRRHSVDVVRRQPPATKGAPAKAAVLGISSPSAAAGGQAVGSPPIYNPWYGGAAAAAAGGRVELPTRASVDLTFKRGPGAFGSPIGALGPAAAAAAAVHGDDAAGGGGGGAGGLDIARMLARASELVVAPPQGQLGNSGGSRDGGAFSHPQSPAHYSDSPSTQSLPTADEQSFRAPPAAAAAAPGRGHGCGPGDAAAGLPTAGVAAIVSGAGTSSLPAATLAHGDAQFHQPFHSHLQQHHRLAHQQPQHHHHHPEGVPYGITQPVRVGRLDPVEEGCGSSTALTAEASSSSVVGTALNTPTAAGVDPASSSGDSGATGAIAATVAAATAAAMASTPPPPPPPLPGIRTGLVTVGERHSADDPLRMLRLPGEMSPTVTAAAAAAAVGASLSNSGPGYHSGGDGALPSSTSSSKASAATPQHARDTGAGASRSGSASAAGAGTAGGNYNQVDTTAEAALTPRSAPSKRSFSSMILKVKKALRGADPRQ